MNLPRITNKSAKAPDQSARSWIARPRNWLAIAGTVFMLIGFGLIGWADGPGKSTTTTTPATSSSGAQTTTTTVESGHQARGSDTIDTFLLGYGAVLLLMYVFYDRLSKFVFPGGAEIDLTPVAEATLAQKVKSKLGPSPSDHAYERALKQALVQLAEAYWGKRASPPEAALEKAADEAAAIVERETSS